MEVNSETPTVKELKINRTPSPDKFFRDMRDKVAGEQPVGFDWDWEPSDFYLPTAIALEKGYSRGGYTTAGHDTAKEKAGYKSTLITRARFDIYCRAFGYGEYGREIKGKHILDIGSGKSLFGAISNYLYGENNTNVVSLDPAYSKPDVIQEIHTQSNEVIPGNYQDAPEQRKAHLVSGLAQEIPFKDNHFDEVISHFGATLVPTEQFSRVVREMTRVTKGKVKIVPMISFANVDSFDLPEGVSLRRIALDGFCFTIDKSEANISKVVNWIKKNAYGNERSVQFHASPDLIKRRQQGYYKEMTLSGYETPLDLPKMPEVDDVELDEYGNIVGTSQPKKSKD